MAESQCTPIVLFEKDVVRFWSKVDRSAGPDACWPWMANCNEKGYGTFVLADKSVKAHRVAFVIANGPVLGNLRVCHSCDVPGCCNPAHLWAGTQLDNIADRVAKGRSVTPTREQLHTNKLTESQVIEILNLRRLGRRNHELARDYGVHCSTISDIVNRRTWRHLDAPFESGNSGASRKSA